MLGNCEKTVITPPTTRPNKWTQIDDHKVSMASSSGSRVMEKPGQELLQQQQQALRCPRCDSSNTKFCYYNNYSLSQPRHFCKACKRYWTRGGTLRNVPVGGGCRKNKRVKRPTNNIDNTTSTTTTASSPSTPSNNSNPPSQPHIDVNPSTILSHINPLLYGSNNSCDVMNMNLPFPARFNSRYDLIQQPQLNALGLGFSSGRILASSEVNDDGYRNGFISSSNNNALLSSYNSIFGGSSTSTTSMPSTPVMVSLLNSTLLQQKFISGGGGGMKGDPFHGMASRQENSSTEAGMVASKEVKGEGQNYISVGNCQNQMEHMGLSDPSLYWNNNNNNTATTALGGAWSDQHQPNIGPSVTSLI